MGLILTGREVTAAEGERLGFVTEIVPHAQLNARALALALSILECSPDSIRASKVGPSARARGDRAGRAARFPVRSPKTQTHTWACHPARRCPFPRGTRQQVVYEALATPNVIDAIDRQSSMSEVRRLFKGENLPEGIIAFNQKRKPVWTSSL